VLASTKEEDSAEEKKEEYPPDRKQKQRLLRDATTLREEDAHAALLIRSRNSKQLFIFVQPTVSRFSPEISFKMSHKKGTNSREIKAHHSFLLLRRFCARFFRSLSPRFDLSVCFFFLREVSVHHRHHRHHLFSLRTHFENVGAENLPLNVISFSLSLSVFLRVVKAEREKERTRLIPFARGSAQRR
jgi:hypothetical protein